MVILWLENEYEGHPDTPLKTQIFIRSFSKLSMPPNHIKHVVKIYIIQLTSWIIIIHISQMLQYMLYKFVYMV